MAEAIASKERVPEESILGTRFAVWKSLQPEKLPEFSYSFFVTTVAVVFAMLAGGTYVYNETLSGNDGPMRVFGIAFLVMPVVPILALFYVQFGNRAKP